MVTRYDSCSVIRVRIFGTILHYLSHEFSIHIFLEVLKEFSNSDLNLMLLSFVSKEYNGSVRNSVLSNVRCNYIEAEGCIMVNVTADSIIAKPGSIIYNIVDDSDFGLELSEGQV